MRDLGGWLQRWLGSPLGSAAKGAAAGAAAGAALGAAATAGREYLKSDGQDEPDEGDSSEPNQDDEGGEPAG
jgi:hypothetical protein